MLTIGYDIGSSSVKASLLDTATGKVLAFDFSPKTEMPINAPQPGWAEQHPEDWWQNLKLAHHSVLAKSSIHPADIRAIGISWQMHGLVLIDKNQNILRPAIIWCDSRAIPFGNSAYDSIGHAKCLSTILNSPGNFTAAKLAWVQKNEPQIYSQIHRILLPGDFIALKLTGTSTTTPEALSEATLWDFSTNKPSAELLNHFNFSPDLIPPLVPIFGNQGSLSKTAAAELNLPPNIPITYRAGDQPNNAASLNVLNPGELAATAGTSGVVYAVSDKLPSDPLNRVNTFAHVNHTPTQTRTGVLLCINGTGILNSWLKKQVAPTLSYPEINALASTSPVGSRGLSIIPFGNGAERILQNRQPDASIHDLNFNTHSQADLLRAAQEGIAHSFKYGMDIMNSLGISPALIRAGNANMFLSPLFRQTLSNLTNSTIELYDTDGAAGAARLAALGANIYTSPTEAFSTLQKLTTITPENDTSQNHSAYQSWLKTLNHQLTNNTNSPAPPTTLGTSTRVTPM